MKNSDHCGRFGTPPLSRRAMLQRAGLGFGWLALGQLLRDDGVLAAQHGHAAQQDGLNLPATGRARSVIFLFMGGGPSQVDTFDPKPLLNRLDGQAVPDSIARGIPNIVRTPRTGLFGSRFRFARHGHSGLPVSELFPETARHADDLCVLRGCRHDSPIHAPAEYMATTGTQIGDRPSLGAWVQYGLGSVNRNLPGFVVLLQNGAAARPNAWDAGFLPPRFQGTLVQPTGIPNAAMPAGTTDAQRRAQMDFMESLNRNHRDRLGGGAELEARIRSYELAFRMQTTAPEAFDLSRETTETRRLYGVGAAPTDEFGTLCLLGRRLVERGVRFVQIRCGGWDSHNNLTTNHASEARKTDRPVAGLLADLQRRGLLDSTLVIWGGEFGRTPAAENPGSPTPGRNHSPSGYSMWLAGGGVKGGQAIGATDEVGYAAVERPVHPNDLHATILHALGVDQNQLVYRHQGRDEIPTVLGGEVISEVFG
jgi:hypothetical protein